MRVARPHVRAAGPVVPEPPPAQQQSQFRRKRGFVPLAKAVDNGDNSNRLQGVRGSLCPEKQPQKVDDYPEKDDQSHRSHNAQCCTDKPVFNELYPPVPFEDIGKGSPGRRWRALLLPPERKRECNGHGLQYEGCNSPVSRLVLEVPHCGSILREAYPLAGIQAKKEPSDNCKGRCSHEQNCQ